MAIEAIKKGISEAMDAVSDKFKDSLSVLTNLKDAGSEKIASLINDVTGLSPLIAESGFSMKDISVDIGLPPSITLTFQKENDIDQEKIERLLEANKDKDLLCIIVKALQKADNFQKGLNMQEFAFKNISMRLGIPPDVIMKFEKRQNP